MWDADRWVAAAKRNARSVQTLVGWIFWDPGALARYEALGVSGPFGYIASRAAPLAGTGPDPVIAAFGSISPEAIRSTFDIVGASTSFGALWRARDAAVREGLAVHAPSTLEPLAEIGPTLWPVIDALPTAGRVFFASHLAMPRPADPVLSGWHAVNCLREWRGDTHWAIVAAEGLTGVEASILHNAWLGYERDWIPVSRGTAASDLSAGWRSLVERGLADGVSVTPDGTKLRQSIEDRTDAACVRAWQLLGEASTAQFPERFEPGCELLLSRVDVTAGTNYQPASRIRPQER